MVFVCVRVCSGRAICSSLYIKCIIHSYCQESYNIYFCKVELCTAWKTNWIKFKRLNQQNIVYVWILVTYLKS